MIFPMISEHIRVLDHLSHSQISCQIISDQFLQTLDKDFTCHRK